MILCMSVTSSLPLIKKQLLTVLRVLVHRNIINPYLYLESIRRLNRRFFLCVLYCFPMTPVEVQAARKLAAAILRRSKEKARDQEQNLAKGEA